MGLNVDTRCTNSSCYQENCFREAGDDGKFRCNTGQTEKVVNYVTAVGLMGALTGYSAYITGERMLNINTEVDAVVCAVGTVTTILFAGVTVALESISRPK